MYKNVGLFFLKVEFEYKQQWEGRTNVTSDSKRLRNLLSGGVFQRIIFKYATDVESYLGILN